MTATCRRAALRGRLEALALFGILSVFSGCSLDDRRLQQAVDSGSGGGGTEALPSAGASTKGGHGGLPSMNDAGSAGQPTIGASGETNQPPIPTVDGCPDLDTDGIADCQETQIANPDFKQDVASWNADTGATLSWGPEDALSGAQSGSALVAAVGAVDAPGTTLLSASQCVPIGSKQLVIVYANAFVEAGQDSDGEASLYVSFFDAANCAGAVNGGFNTPTPLNASVGTWLTVQAGSLTGAATQSALVKLAIEKPYRAAAFQARFDNVLLEQRPVQ